MAYFAVISNNKVIDAIVADTLETAQSISNRTCIEYTQANPIAVGSILVDGIWVSSIEVIEEVSE